MTEQTASWVIRPYRPADRPGVRAIYGDDEFARPHLMHKYPRMSAYLADSMSYHTDYEPESVLVAEAEGQIVGALLGSVDATRPERVYRRHIQPRVIWRYLSGAYGWPGWLPSVLRTEWAQRHTIFPEVDLDQHPAHLHIGLLPAWRRRGIGTRLMAGYADYLVGRGVPGYHLYAASFHPLGMAFYRKLGLEKLGQFLWHFHDGLRWSTVVETIFARKLN